MNGRDMYWVAYLAQWAWLVIGAITSALVIGCFKLWKAHVEHGVRLDVLEDHHKERVQKMDQLAASIEEGRRERMQQVDRLQATVESNRIAFDHRLDTKIEQLRTHFRHDVRDTLNATLLQRRRDSDRDSDSS